MSLHDEIRKLHELQSSTDDGLRLFHDGSIKQRSLTESMEMGWCIVARSVPGASLAFRNYFPSRGDGIYLQVENIRDAMTIRDMMLTTLVESRVHRQSANELKTKPTAITPGGTPVLF